MKKQNTFKKVPQVVEILDRISLPASPFHEEFVAREIYQVFTELPKHPNLTFSQDRNGNLVINYWNSTNPQQPCLALAAHMDHPGFDLVEINGNRIKARFMGKLPNDQRIIGTRALIIDGTSQWKGTIDTFADEAHDHVWIKMKGKFCGDLVSSFAVPDVTRFKIRGSFVDGRAMDDLVGCAIQLAVVEGVIRRNLPIDFTAIFHRAEEVGFIGAVGACELGTIPLRSLVISLEASKNLEGAMPGSGVVIRTGDRLYLFDPNAENLLNQAAEKLAEHGTGVQRRRMDGGVCEASCYLAYGYESTALAVPLINYHNHGESACEPEAVHIQDLQSAVDLLLAAAELVPDYKRMLRTDFSAFMKRKFNESMSRIASFRAIHQSNAEQQMKGI